MKLKLAFSVGALAVLALIGVTVAEMQLGAGAQDAADSATQESDVTETPQTVAAADTAETTGEEAKADAPARPNPPKAARPRARGLFVRRDGSLVGRVNSIDGSTLTLVPVPNALVSFMQKRKVVAQGVTNADGMFAVKGLTPWAVYSVFIASKGHVSTFATFARPFEPEPALQEPGGNDVSLNQEWVNEIHFVAMLADDPEGEGDGSSGGSSAFSGIQVIPAEDFNAALNQGLFGPGVSPPGGLAGGGAGGAGGGGTGGGGGGAGGGGAGGAAGAVAGVAVGAAAIGASQSDGGQASPFRP